MNIISRPCHQSRIPILFTKISICISLTYNVLSVFDCITPPMELMYDYFCYTIICQFGSFQHLLVSYVIISILLPIETVLLPFTIHPKIRYINIVFILISLIVYPAFMLICFLVCLSNFNVMWYICALHFKH